MKKGYKKRVGSYSGRVDFFLLIGIVVIAVFGFCSYLYISNDEASEERCFSYRDIPEKRGVEIVDYDVGSCGKSPIIPTFLGWKPVLSIGEGAFGNKEIMSVVLPKMLVSIKRKAFENNNLSAVMLSSSLEEIGKEAFVKNKLVSVVIPGSVKVVGINAFGWNALQNVIIEEGVEIIARGAFQDNSIRRISFPQSIQKVGMWAFVGNETFPSLIDILNPNTCFGPWSFYNSGDEKKGPWEEEGVKFQDKLPLCSRSGQDADLIYYPIFL